MNWKNVLFLLRVERKSGRLIRGIKATRYREHGILAYLALLACCNPRHNRRFTGKLPHNNSLCRSNISFRRITAFKRFCIGLFRLNANFDTTSQLGFHDVPTNSTCRNQKKLTSHVLATCYMARTHLSIYLI